MTLPIIRLATVPRDHRSILANIRNFLFAPRSHPGRRKAAQTLNHRARFLWPSARASGP